MALRDQSQPHRGARGSASPDIDQLLPEGRARDAARMRTRQGERVRQHKRARSPSTPRARSVSVDSEVDIVRSQRDQVIQQARRISKHWDSGAPGRAPRQRAAPLGPLDVAALDAQRRRATDESARRMQAFSQRSPSDMPVVIDSSDEVAAEHDAAPQTPRREVLCQFQPACAVDAFALGQGSQNTSHRQLAAQHEVVDVPLAVIADAAVSDSDEFKIIGFSPR